MCWLGGKPKVEKTDLAGNGFQILFVHPPPPEIFSAEHVYKQLLHQFEKRNVIKLSSVSLIHMANTIRYLISF